VDSGAAFQRGALAVLVDGDVSLGGGERLGGGMRRINEKLMTQKRKCHKWRWRVRVPGRR
jgi:hypothetical protein